MPRTALPLISGAVLALLPLALAAQEAPALGRDYRAWGTTTSSYVRLVPREEHPAEVVFINRVTVGNPLAMDFRLEIDGLSVDVSVMNGEGDVPDVITVRPPPGFVAEPETLAVREDETGRIVIRAVPMS